MLPFTYDALAERFATVRPWAKKTIGDSTNRCAICMGYTLRLTPSEDDATIEKLAKVANRVNADAGPAGGARPLTTLSASFFIRAAELEPRVRRIYGEPDVQGVSNKVWRSVLGKRGGPLPRGLLPDRWRQEHVVPVLPARERRSLGPVQRHQHGRGGISAQRQQP